MLLKKLFVFIAAFALAKAATAQRVSLSFGNKEKTTPNPKKGGLYNKSLSINGEEVLSVFKVKAERTPLFGGSNIFTSVKLIKFKKGVPDKEVDIEFPRNEHKGYVDMVKLHNNYFLLSYSIEKSTSMSIEYQQLDVVNFSLSPAKLLAKLDLTEYTNTDVIEASDLRFDYSPDSTKLLFAYEPDLKRKANKEIVLAAADESMHLLNQMAYSFDEVDKKIKMIDVAIDNEGSIYLSYNQYEKDYNRDFTKKDGDKIPGFTTKLCVLEGKNKTIYPFVSEGKFVHSSTIAYDERGKICIVGLYKDSHNGRVTGVFKAPLDETKKQFGSPAIFEAFPQEILDKVDIDDMGNKKGRKIGLDNDFLLKYSISVSPVGTIYLISEFHEITGAGRDLLEAWGDVVITTFTAGTKAKPTFALIRKRQVKGYLSESSLSERFKNQDYKYLVSSFEPIVFKDKLLVFYTDHEDNQTMDQDKKPQTMATVKKASLMMSEINAKGVLTKNTFVFGLDNLEGHMIKMQFTYVKDNVYAIVAPFGGLLEYTTKIGTLTIK
jgi:hypothetical protein